jgi:hypothetical protein
LDPWVWIPTGFVPGGHGHGLENSPMDPIGSGTRNTSGRVRIVYFTHGYPLDTRNINSQFYKLCFWPMKQRKKAQSSEPTNPNSLSSLPGRPPRQATTRQRPAPSRQSAAATRHPALPSRQPSSPLWRCPTPAPCCVAARPAPPSCARRACGVPVSSARP